MIDNGVVPVPLTAMVVGEFEALLTTVTFPEKEPVEAGVKRTLKLMLAPGFTDWGIAGPMTTKLLDDELMPEIVTVSVPELVTCTARVAVPPLGTLPKLMVVGDTDRILLGDWALARGSSSSATASNLGNIVKNLWSGETALLTARRDARTSFFKI